MIVIIHYCLPSWLILATCSQFNGSGRPIPPVAYNGGSIGHHNLLSMHIHVFSAPPCIIDTSSPLDPPVVRQSSACIAWRDLTKFPTDSHPADSHPTDSHPTDSHPTDSHPTDSHPTDSQHGGIRLCRSGGWHPSPPRHFYRDDTTGSRS
jgi:hypothetical protein